MKTLTKATIVTAAAATVLTGGYFYMQPLANHSDTQAITDPTPLPSPSDTPSSITVTTTPTPTVTPDTNQVGNNPQVPQTQPTPSPTSDVAPDYRSNPPQAISPPPPPPPR